MFCIDAGETLTAYGFPLIWIKFGPIKSGLARLFYFIICKIIKKWEQLCLNAYSGSSTPSQGSTVIGVDTMSCS